jgi:hypothetical protein
LHGRVVDRRSVVEMARTVMVIRRLTDEGGAQTRVRQRACPRSLKSPATGQILGHEVLVALVTGASAAGEALAVDGGWVAQ